MSLQEPPKVYVIQENRLMDYGPAEQFGEIVFLTADEFKPMNQSLLNDRVIESIKAGLSRFRADTDFLVLTGSPTIIGFTFAEALSKCGPIEGIKVLQWDKRDGAYRPFVFQYKVSDDKG